MRPLGTSQTSPATRRSRWATLTDKLLHLHDTPERTAAALALGVFFSFSPFIGLQILLSMALALAFGLNRVAVFVGLNANLPWFIVPWYGGTTLLAASVLGLASPAEMRQRVESLFTAGWSPMGFFERAADLLSTAFLPLLVGSTAGAVLMAMITYPIAREVLVRRARRMSRGNAFP
jgi:uncharacterized protein (DUF2062 family)